MFASAPLLPYFPDGLEAEYTCHAFPEDDNPRDSFIVALIALAGAFRNGGLAALPCIGPHSRPPTMLATLLPVAIPVTIFLSNCFEMANDSECPEVQWHALRACVLCVLAYACTPD
jgi:hypothetical protein